MFLFWLDSHESDVIVFLPPYLASTSCIIKIEHPDLVFYVQDGQCIVVSITLKTTTISSNNWINSVRLKKIFDFVICTIGTDELINIFPLRRMLTLPLFSNFFIFSVSTWLLNCFTTFFWLRYLAGKCEICIQLSLSFAFKLSFKCTWWVYPSTIYSKLLSEVYSYE